ncbi:hypothetical protein NLX86_17520 [Streptomyces sp. A3M-1-3]|uniref:hypothetical protein n=1 Tax=Streptomyces sp. A3M-1-3 TaxID=2962044 RepID=UPI0020B84EC5|nr:hypothetical protein [Streptomyces sp. A3M-1-3]MCP3819829.1 hypothetical protein [Streptomyces sp. A3M-1-3]
MRRRIIAAVSAGAAGLALGVMPATGAFASSDTRSDYGCSDWRSWDDRRHHCDDRDDHDDRNLNDVVIILVALT